MKCPQGITVQAHFLRYYPYYLQTPSIQSEPNHTFFWPPGSALFLVLTTWKLRHFISCISLVNDNILFFLYIPYKWQDIALPALACKRQDVWIINCFLSPSLYLTEDTVCLQCNNQSHKSTQFLIWSVLVLFKFNQKWNVSSNFSKTKPKYEMSQKSFQSKSSRSTQRDGQIWQA
jgi:hypothetical protein